MVELYREFARKALNVNQSREQIYWGHNGENMTRTKSAVEHDIHDAVNKLKDQAEEKETELMNLMSSLYEKMQEKKDKVVDTVESTASTVNTSVHLHPWRYIGGAALIGVAVGLLLRR